MADVSKTNLFRVTDEKRYKELFSRLESQDEIDDFTCVKDGKTYHGFGTYDIPIYVDPDDTSGFNDIDAFVEEIQKILPEGEVFIYVEAGHEKLRDLTAYATICTKDEIKNISFTNVIMEAAREMLGPNFKTDL